MKIAIFDTHSFERKVFDQINSEYGYSLSYFEPRLNSDTALLAKGYPVVCSFVNDRLDEMALRTLSSLGVRLIALRSAGFNQVDLKTADQLKLPVVRVPAYSPHAVAEHAVCLILALNRKIHRAYTRVRELNFALDGLVGFDLYGKTVGVVGTGKIGRVMCQIMMGFGCRVLAYDLYPDREVSKEGRVQYVPLKELYREADIVSLHIPLTTETRHLVDSRSFSLMKKGVMLINTGRGALIDTPALIQALKIGQVGSAGLDVYEEEEKYFFQNLEDQVLQDDVLARLLTFPNVLITAHQAFLTAEALDNIVRTTLENIKDFEQDRPLKNQVYLSS